MCLHTRARSIYSCAFVFVLEVEENRILAEQALLLIGNLVKDYIIKDHSVAEVRCHAWIRPSVEWQCLLDCDDETLCSVLSVLHENKHVVQCLL